MNESIRLGLKNIKILRKELDECTSDIEALDIYKRLQTMMSCVIYDVVKLIGEREGEGKHKDNTDLQDSC